MKFLNSRQFVKFVSGIFGVLLFLGVLFWAREQDPFTRKWFKLKTADHGSVCCVAVLPKPMRQYPVVIYAHGSGDRLLYDGDDLRQMAELGLAVVSLEYNKTNEVIFDAQFETLLRYLDQQRWANTKAIAWVGFSLGANQLLDFAVQHPAQQSQLLVLLSGAGQPEGQTNSRLELLRCPVLLVHGEQDEIFPATDTEHLASILQTNGLPVELKILPGIPHGMEPERSVVFRGIAESCLMHLAGRKAWQNYHSIARWQADAPPLWLFWLPAAAWAVGWFAWLRCRKAALSEQIKLKRHEIALRWLAVILGIWALAETAIHLITPQFQVADAPLAVTRRFLVQPKERSDFEYLIAQPIWQGQKLKTLLTHLELAGYNRELINWRLDDKLYRDFVLSPIIEPSTFNLQLSTALNWRRPLWEEFYPRIRRESSSADAAHIVMRHLRERVTIAAVSNSPQDVSTIWLRPITDEAGFARIYVAALRSVGVPAQLNSQHQAEFWDGTKWGNAPRPSVVSW